MTIEKEVELMNEIIAQAVIHGGDNGGPYLVNIDGLYNAIQQWIKEKELEDKYKIIMTDYIFYSWRATYPDIFQIVNKNDPREEYHKPKRHVVF